MVWVRNAGREQPWRATIRSVLFGLAWLCAATEAMAQSLTGGPINAATGRSQAEAVSQNEKELIDRQVLGGGAQGGSAAAAGLTTFTTGRLRSSDHDTLRTRPPADQSFSFATTEASAFANVVVSVPGTVLGGQMKVSGFVGQNEVSLDLKSNALSVLDANQSGRARNASIIAGGTALWSHLNSYALASLVGSWGQTTLKDGVDDCGYDTPPHPSGCNHNRYNFNTSGFIGTLTAGQVFDLGGGPSAPKLDLRGSLGYTHNSGDPFKNVLGDQQKYTFSTWVGTGAATLFSNMALSEGAFLRPYIQGYVRQEWGYRSQFEAIQSDGVFLGVFRQDQKHLYGGVDAGVTYSQNDTTFGASIYYEASGDEGSLGGRLGLSQKLDSATQRAKGITWSGFYVGVNGGMAWSDVQAGTSAVCNDTHDPALVPPAFNGIDCPFASVPVDQLAVIGTAGSGGMSDRGFLGGAQAGVNVQKGSVVYGFEVDVQSFKLGASRTGTTPDPNNAANLITVATAFDTDWLFTARSRLGWAVSPNFLLYATGGVAATELGVSNSLSSSVSSAQAAGSAGGRVIGWTLGGGAEWALSPNWTLRGEYLHLDFGKVTANAQVRDPAHDFSTNMTTTVELTAQIVRAGLNYKF
jgi:outer membrane immunogenic protein